MALLPSSFVEVVPYLIIFGSAYALLTEGHQSSLVFVVTLDTEEFNEAFLDDVGAFVVLNPFGYYLRAVAYFDLELVLYSAFIAGSSCSCSSPSS